MNPFDPRTKNISNPLSIAAGVSRAKLPLGAVPGVPSPETLQKLKQFGVANLVLVANIPQQLPIEGDYVYIRNSDKIITSANQISSNTIVSLVDSNNNTQVLDLAGMGYIFPMAFQWIRIISTQTITLTVSIGYGRIQNDASIRYCVGVGDTAVQSLTRPNNVNAYAANQVVADGVNVIEFPRITRLPGLGARLTRARLTKNSVTTANADFSLYLLMTSPGVLVDAAAFAMTAALFNFEQAVIRFPTFITGGAGSDCAICDIGGIVLPVKTSVASTPQLNNLGGGGSLFGILVANAAYVPTALESFRIDLFTDQY